MRRYYERNKGRISAARKYDPEKGRARTAVYAALSLTSPGAASQPSGARMTLTPPSSHGGGSAIGPVAIYGTPTAGYSILALSPTTGEWAPPGRVQLGLSGLPILGTVFQTSVVDFFTQLYETVTSPPLVYAASGNMGFSINLLDVPDISDTLDLVYRLFLTNEAGTESGLVTGSPSTSTPTGSYSVDFTGTSATLVGTDLTWDDTTGSFTTAAGGVFTAFVVLNTGPD